jgi:serine/threonine-protein kinase RsbW
MQEVGEFELSVPARSENLVRIRRALTDFASSLGVDDETISDLRLAVNEACSNVVRHAYGTDDPGSMCVEARPADGSLVVVVRDTGRGLSRASGDPGAGLGLRLASAVSNSFEVRQKTAGTEVRLVFSLGNAA